MNDTTTTRRQASAPPLPQHTQAAHPAHEPKRRRAAFGHCPFSFMRCKDPVPCPTPLTNAQTQYTTPSDQQLRWWCPYFPPGGDPCANLTAFLDKIAEVVVQRIRTGNFSDLTKEISPLFDSYARSEIFSGNDGLNSCPIRALFLSVRTRTRTRPLICAS